MNCYYVISKDQNCVSIIHAQPSVLWELEIFERKKNWMRKKEKENTIRSRSYHFRWLFGSTQFTNMWNFLHFFFSSSSSKHHSYSSVALFFLLYFIMSSFIFIFFFSLSYISLLFSPRPSSKATFSLLFDQHSSFIATFYQSSNFHMIYNMIFPFVRFYLLVDEWRLANEYDEQTLVIQIQIGKVLFTLAELN